jgi:hypothetical protein
MANSRELFARISNHVLHNLEWGGRSEGPRGRQHDAVEFGVPLGTDPLLPERVLLDRGNQRWEYMASIQCHIIRVAEANGATSGCLVSVKNMTYHRSSPYWMKSWVSEIVARDRDLAETQRPLGPVHTQNEAE